MSCSYTIVAMSSDTMSSCHVCSDMCERLMAESSREEDLMRVAHEAELVSTLASANAKIRAQSLEILDLKHKVNLYFEDLEQYYDRLRRVTAIGLFP